MGEDDFRLRRPAPHLRTVFAEGFPGAPVVLGGAYLVSRARRAACHLPESPGLRSGPPVCAHSCNVVHSAGPAPGAEDW